MVKSPLSLGIGFKSSSCGTMGLWGWIDGWGQSEVAVWTAKQINSSWKCNFSISGMLLSASHRDCRIINWCKESREGFSTPPSTDDTVTVVAAAFLQAKSRNMAKICHDKWRVITLLFTTSIPIIQPWTTDDDNWEGWQGVHRMGNRNFNHH